MTFGVVRPLCAVEHLGAVVADVAYKSICRRHPHPFRLVWPQQIDGRSRIVVVVEPTVIVASVQNNGLVSICLKHEFFLPNHGDNVVGCVVVVETKQPLFVASPKASQLSS
jgi:hypothetical protein